jgi:hypothetical protein
VDIVDGATAVFSAAIDGGVTVSGSAVEFIVAAGSPELCISQAASNSSVQIVRNRLQPNDRRSEIMQGPSV